ncbi:aldehyde dehydrogenase [Streptomyces sp. NPDC005549]|uniref:aldehyde dehydrogenase n=1 Tax=Streptomyces sp. NPDC005549 TaxID=3154888 RepID=UPI0033A8AA2F
MTNALSPLVARPESLFIDGQWVSSSTNTKISVVDSVTEQEFLSVAAAGGADVERAVVAAREAFDNGPWPRMSLEERTKVFGALAEQLDARAEQHARAWTLEAGALYSFTSARSLRAGSDYLAYADVAADFPFEERHASKSGGEIALLLREPVGVVAAIVPWNAAPSSIVKKVAPALISGCTVILKAAPEAPASAYILAEACEAAGFPPGVVNVLAADREVSEVLVRNRGVDKVSFTGSTAAGRKIASICAERMARFTMELGGKSPAIIFDDYDIETAARQIASRATQITGQVCAALTRIIVPRNRHDALVEALSESFGKAKVGDPFDPDVEMGPLAMRRQMETVQSYIAKGVDEGAVLAAGGGRPAHLDRGFFVEPTVFANVDNHSTIAREEVFGPVLAVVPVESEEDAVDIANDTAYGLNASVFTNDVERAYSVARRIRSGTVGQNGVRNENSIAFGGYKQSGIGREGGAEGLRSYLETKVVVLDAIPETAG